MKKSELRALIKECIIEEANTFSTPSIIRLLEKIESGLPTVHEDHIDGWVSSVSDKATKRAIKSLSDVASLITEIKRHG